MRRLILGTAGHIDHGKTALVRALTGVDTDRLPEEKRRGITIDLGFARLPLGDDLELGIVDVPGHEAFVRNMLAGATGIDLVLLVVAADEGVMPQTREHAAIVDLLGVTRGVVALTKCDLVDDDWLDLVRDDVSELLAATRLTGAPIVPVSARTGAGLDALRDRLRTAAAAVPDRQQDDLFRMPIDRVFTVRGTGTVVTGTVWSGRLHADEQVRVEPAGLTVRVRSLQRHGAPCDEVGAGERAAIALAAADRALLTRGDTLLGGAAWRTSDTLTVRLAVLADAGAPLRHRQRLRVSLGTAEVLARVYLPAAEVAPGEASLAQLRLERSIVARALDRFVLRAWSPVRTIAGGVVVEPFARRRKQFGAAGPLLERIAVGPAADAGALVEAVLELAGPAGADRAELPLLSGLPPRSVDGALAEGREVRLIGARVVARRFYETARDVVLHTLREFHARAPLEDGCERDTVRRSAGTTGSAWIVDAAVQDLLRSGTIIARGRALALAEHEPRPDDRQQDLLHRLTAHYATAGLQAPELAELPPELDTPATATLLRYLERDGTLVRLGGTRWADAAALRSGISAVCDQLRHSEELGIADFRDVLKLSRKHLIPLLEYFDRCGVTVRTGESRRVACLPPAANGAAPPPAAEA